MELEGQRKFWEISDGDGSVLHTARSGGIDKTDDGVEGDDDESHNNGENQGCKGESEPLPCYMAGHRECTRSVSEGDHAAHVYTASDG